MYSALNLAYMFLGGAHLSVAINRAKDGQWFHCAFHAGFLVISVMAALAGKKEARRE